MSWWNYLGLRRGDRPPGLSSSQQRDHSQLPLHVGERKPLHVGERKYYNTLLESKLFSHVLLEADISLWGEGGFVLNITRELRSRKHPNSFLNMLGHDFVISLHKYSSMIHLLIC